VAGGGAQQPAVPVIGFLHTDFPDRFTDRLRYFRQGLSEKGYVEGRNVAIEHRAAESQYDRLPALAAELVRRRVAVIVPVGTPAALAAKAATTTIPIVFSTGADPVALGLVASLNRPGANLTGINSLETELEPKELQLLHELLLNAARLGILADPAFPDIQSVITELQAAARALRMQLAIVNAGTDSDLERAFANSALGPAYAGGVTTVQAPRTRSSLGWAVRHPTAQSPSGGLPARRARAAVSTWTNSPRVPKSGGRGQASAGSAGSRPRIISRTTAASPRTRASTPSASRHHGDVAASTLFISHGALE
jgi:hypothetical protein